MKNGFYIEYDLVGYGGRNRKTRIVQPMTSGYVGQEFQDATAYAVWMREHLKHKGDIRHMENIKVFLVKKIWEQAGI